MLNAETGLVNVPRDALNRSFANKNAERKTSHGLSDYHLKAN